MTAFQPGDILFGKYRIERFLTQGGFGEIYLATHLTLNSPRVLKVLIRKGNITTSTINAIAERFRLEAQLGARFANENHIVRVYDFEWDKKRDLLALVTEYMPGGSLKDKLHRLREEGKPGLSINEAVRTAYHVALGLAALHKAGLVHRDIKPSNILYDARGNAKVSDLGVVQIPHGITRRTELGEDAPPHPGTPEYMSPEQVHTVDYLPPASDIYSLGVTLFEALTLHKYKHLRPGTRVRDLRPEVPLWFDELIVRMLAKAPESRPWDGAELARLLEPYLQSGVSSEESTLWDDLTDTEATEVLTEEQKGSSASVTPPPPPKPPGQDSPPKAPQGPQIPQRSSRPRFLVGLILALLLAIGIVLIYPRRIFQSMTFQQTPTSVRTLTPFFTRTPTLTSTPASIPTATSASLTWPLMPNTPTPRLNTITLENIESLALLRVIEAHTKAITSVAFSTDFVASASGDKTVRIWRVRTGTLKHTLRGHSLGVLSVAFSSNKRFIASGSWDRTVRLWTVDDGQLVRILPHRRAVTTLAFSPDDKLLATGSSDKVVRLWEMPDGGTRSVLYGHQDWVTSVAFSPDGVFLASGSRDGTIRVWRISDEKLVYILEGHTNWVTSIAFSPDSKFLASASRDGTVRLWRMSDGALIYTFEQEGNIRGVAFSPDGVLLASGSGSGTVRLWNTENGEVLRVLNTGQWVTSVAFAPDGTLLSAGLGNGAIWLWGVPKK